MGYVLVFNLDPHTRHYPDGDAKKRLNNLSSMPDFRRKCQLGGEPTSKETAVDKMAQLVEQKSRGTAETFYHSAGYARLIRRGSADNN